MIDVLTHENRPRMAGTDEAYDDDVAPEKGSPFRPLYDDKIMFSGQPIALVLAEDSEIARYAASLVRVKYDEEAHVTDLMQQRDQAFEFDTPDQTARQCGEGFAPRRGSPRGRILCSDGTSQSDGVICLHRDLGWRRQADGL